MPEYLQVIVPCDTVSAKEPLNVLSGVSGFTERTEMTVHLWGRAADKWKALDSVTFTAEKGEHKHLYFSISPEKLTPARARATASSGLTALMAEVMMVSA